MQYQFATFVIETSTAYGSVGLQITGRISGAAWQEETFFSDRGHNCEIFAPLQQISAISEPGSIQQIIVGTGPGSYSGTRVGIAVAQGLAIAHHCSIIGLPSLLGMPTAREMSRCLAIGDARRGDWWWAWMEGGKMRAAPSMGKIEELHTQIAKAERVISLDAISHPSLDGIVRKESPTAHALWQAWSELAPAEQTDYAAQPLQPLYLKPPHITAAKTGHPLQRS